MAEVNPISEKNKVWPVFKRLLKYIAPLKGILFIAVLGLITYGIVDALFIAFLKPFIDEGFDTGKPSVTDELMQNAGMADAGIDVLGIAPFVVIGMFIVRGVANFVSNYSLAYVSNQIILKMRQEVFEHYLKLPVSYVDQQNAGTLISRVTYDTEQIARASGNALIVIVRDSVSILAYLGWMFYLSWQLTLSILVVAPLIGIVITVVSRRFRKVSVQIQSAMGDVTVATEQMVKGHKNVLIFGGQKEEAERFAEVNDRNRSRNMKLALTHSISQPVIMIIGSLALALVLAAANIDSFKADLTAGAFASMIAAMLAMLQPIKNLSNVNAEFQRGIAACATVFALLDTKTEEDKGQYQVARVKGDIVFDKVDFRYPNAPDLALKQFDVEIKAGTTLALVGRSGSGKSTVTNLITRFYDQLESGEIRIDGVNVNDFKLKNLRSQIALVSQQVSLFNDTIANNIAYACDGNVTREQIEAAAEAAHAMEFIKDLPNGLDTEVGENGVLLSGGQRQRIAIARAILRDAPILILDEATSALDTESERAIQDALETLQTNRTSIMVAHRLSTIEKADRILVVDKGRVIESGDHQSLLAQKGNYYQLHQLQFGNE
ncbi:lipid A export permease/ATP-binding protein MsbA [Paraferrimonas sedimenticola]|uniref:Lipid A export ATP-binding/permease protein MsbA n=1 Tax=Paraferrimonas sedimenticola TaxID=375674 RepID=A0AA37RM97_9GAMM|nr:lipid A export permease/ATP-binding protein MsbA [Paraferrimonas sedimenticola]GLP94880.1 lipid A export ATP-binding/permease protein MsbA [Paraferrimonas sedimenticola]